MRAYARLARSFAQLSASRSKYLAGIEREIAGAIPSGSGSLLDVGAGDGTRALRIAQAARIERVTLVEPAEGMLGAVSNATVSSLRAEQLGRFSGSFDIVLCLWNVLGHVFPSRAREQALRGLARLAAPGARVFVDVSHRYNFRHYGLLPTVGRYLRDRWAWTESSGDTEVHWDTAEGRVATRGHVFRDQEFRNLAAGAGLVILDRRAVDYASGERRRWSGQGHLLYTLAPVATGDYPQGEKNSHRTPLSV